MSLMNEAIKRVETSNIWSCNSRCDARLFLSWRLNFELNQNRLFKLRENDYSANTIVKGGAFMSIFAGIWMDHSKAVTVILGNENLDMSIIESSAESPAKGSGGHHQVAPYAHQDVVAEDHRQHKHAAETNEYFHKIYRRIKAADELVLIGPGEARKEFINFLMQQRLSIKVRGCMPAGLMSNREVARQVCRAFNRAYH